MRGLWFWIFLGLWAGCFIKSFSFALWADTTGDGFVRGLNRISDFLWWQLAAGVFALCLWYTDPGSESRLMQWIGRVPFILALLLALAVIAVIVWIKFF